MAKRIVANGSAKFWEIILPTRFASEAARPPSATSGTVVTDCRPLWKNVVSASASGDEGKAVQILAKILLDKEDRASISKLERKDAELCIEILDHVSRDLHPLPSRYLRYFHQGLAEHVLQTAERQAFFITLRRLAAIYGRLPESVVITEKVKVSDDILASGGFADVRTGTYKGHLVAVKTMRVAKQDDIVKLRKVSVCDILPAARNATLTIFLSYFAKRLSSGIRCPIRTS
jgi:hypothetical protein